MSERPTRTFERDGERWRAIDAWRGTGGLGLLYFLRLDGDRPLDDDRADLRGVLEPGARIEEASAERLAELLDPARPLTETERRIVDATGDLWLVQNTGPVWAEQEAAADTTGVRFRPLTRDGPTIAVPGAHVRDLTPDHLVRRLERELAARKGELPGRARPRTPGEPGGAARGQTPGPEG